MSGVPRSRGTPTHFEHDGDTSFCEFERKGNQLVAVHTPQDSFRRTHEIMHSRHTDAKRMRLVYRGVNQSVFDITEDCRLHSHHWPWSSGTTPDFVRKDYAKIIAEEMKTVEEHVAEDPTYRGSWPDFATRLRHLAVTRGMDYDGRYIGHLYSTAGFASDTQVRLAQEVCELIDRRNEGKAAQMLQTVFFPPQEAEERASGKKLPGSGNCKQPKLEIIELPHTEIIKDAKAGYRKATSGSRLHRPSLRKPVLPQRIFIRKTPREVHGTILVDASGSMGDWDQVSKWCELAPFGTIAYYAGGHRDGKLFVYARNGRKAKEIVNPHMGGNTVDGPAIDWLLTQAKPRIMITDRKFCGAADSFAQVGRLDQLERTGEIKVMDYSNK
jgi:hypothetical protein